MDSDKLTLKDFVYISTLSDLGAVWLEHDVNTLRGREGSAMLKLDVAPGQYVLQEYLDGYLLTKEGYSPNLKDVLKIFNTRDCDKGLSGTYHDGAIEDEKRMRIFNNWLRFYLHEEYLVRIRDDFDEEGAWDEEYQCWNEESDSGMEFNVRTEEDAPIKMLDCLPYYHSLPVFFYLNQSIDDDDLMQISLKYPIMKKCGNVRVFWRVVHDQYGDIGIAVLQKELHLMMGDQAGMAFFATDSANAFGNFDYYQIDQQNRNLFVDELVSYPCYEYHCKRTACNCDWSYIK